MRFEVVVNIMTVGFWEVPQWSLADYYKYIGENICLHFQRT
jgi:hypothetical protein